MFLGLFKRKVKTAKPSPKKKVAKVKEIKPKAKVIGQIVHYFPHVKAGVIKLTKGPLAVGETIQIKGHTTDLKQKVVSLQIDNKPIEKGKKGEEVGLLVKDRVRECDTVYKLQ